MKRKLAAILMSLSILGAQTVWAEGFLGLGKINTDGSLEVLGQQANNETDFLGDANDHRGNTITRVRVGLGMPEITEGVAGRIELVRNSNGNINTVQYGNGQPTNLNTEENTIQIQNAYVDLSNFLYTDQVRLGRQYDGRQGDLLLYHGPTNDDAMSVTAFDSLLVKKKVGPVDALFSTGKLFEGEPAPGNPGATDASGTAADVNLTYLILSSDSLFSAIRLPLELGWYQVKNSVTNATTGDNQTLAIYDLRAKYGFLGDSLWVSGQYAMNGGQDNDNNTTTVPASKTKYKGSAYILKVDYNSADKPFGLKAMLANASGQNQSATSLSSDKAFHDGGNLGHSASDFRYGEILTNSLNNIGSTGLGPVTTGVGAHPGLDTGDFGVGLNVINLGGHYVPPVMDNKVTLTLDYFTVKANKVVSGADKKVGNEIDVAAVYHHSDAVTASVGYATLSPGTGLASGFAANPTNVPTDKVTKMFAKISIKWGSQPEDEYKSEAPAKPAAKPATRKR